MSHMYRVFKVLNVASAYVIRYKCTEKFKAYPKNYKAP